MEEQSDTGTTCSLNSLKLFYEQPAKPIYALFSVSYHVDSEYPQVSHPPYATCSSLLPPAIGYLLVY